jgi:endothelin-converting enzyme/putative endopeptidase
MAPETRQRALEKLSTYDAQVGAPHRFADDGRLVLRREAFWANVAAARRRGVEEDRRRVGKPTDRDVWQLPASSSFAYIDPQLNQIVLPAGFLLAIGFRPDADDPELYGGIGVGIAHDLTHALDAGGADCDPRAPARGGRCQRAIPGARRLRRGRIPTFQVEPGLHLDGKRVRGRRPSGDLHRRSAAGAPGAGQGGGEHRCRPIPAWARPPTNAFHRWAGSRAGGASETGAGSPRAIPPPGRFRVLGTLVHLPSSSRAFACKPGAKRMVRRPEALSVMSVRAAAALRRAPGQRRDASGARVTEPAIVK